MTETVRKGPVGFTIVAELGISRQITVGGNFPEDATREQIDKTLDPILEAINRQQAKTALINIDGEIESMELNLRMQQEDIERIDTRHLTSTKPQNAIEKQQREAAVINTRRLQDDIDLKRKARAEYAEQAK